MKFPIPDMPDHNRIIEGRYHKIDDLQQRELAAFAWRFNPTHNAQSIHYAEDELAVDDPMSADNDNDVRIAGRVMSIRKMGKAAFFHLLDGSGRLQVYIKKNVLDEESYQVYNELLDMGDIVGVAGPVFRTKTGEITVLAREFQLLTKSVRPLPEKWHGLKDTEARFRQRYVDLIVNDKTRETFRTRSEIISHLRRMLDERGYMEVETPMMQLIHGGAAARPFVTHHNALDIDLYLRIAPELFLKRLLVGGFEKVYEINRNFRNEGLSTRHNPEFTMLELYTAYWDYFNTMDLTEQLIRKTAQSVCGKAQLEYQEQRIDLGQPFRRATILDLIRETLNVDAEKKWHWGMEGREAWDSIYNNALLEKIGRERFDKLTFGGSAVSNFLSDKQIDCDLLLMDLFEVFVEPKLIQPTFITEFPKSRCPLAKSKEGDPATAERFELFVGGLEMANAYSELNDPAEQYEMFRRQVEAAREGDAEAQPMDEDYVRALEYGMPPASGLGIGIDRLVMLLTDQPSIREVILFPTMRPVTSQQLQEAAELEATDSDG